MIVMIHGGPHGQQGPAFNSKAQVFAAQGWAALMVNYRGSTGYGQKLADAIFGDQNGGEAKDVLAGVDAALAKYAWIDRTRLGIEGGSYGGQLTNWIVTQTDRFRAAIPLASISNLVSFNYMAYYHDYLAVEFGSFPHQKGLMDVLWQRSPIRYVQNVKTPVMLLHGENDNDVPIAEAEQFYIALRDAGVDSIMVRYPREGHGIRETKHVVDVIDRSIQRYRRHFTAASTARPVEADGRGRLQSAWDDGRGRLQSAWVYSRDQEDHPDGDTDSASPKSSARRRFPRHIVAAIDQSKILGIRAGTRTDHRFIGIWAVVVGDRVFARSWTLKPGGLVPDLARGFLRHDPGGRAAAPHSCRPRRKQTYPRRCGACLRAEVRNARLAQVRSWIPHPATAGCDDGVPAAPLSCVTGSKGVKVWKAPSGGGRWTRSRWSSSQDFSAV